MSGAEAIAVLGMISSVVAIVDATKQVYDAASNTTGLPRAFSEVAGRLPIVREILRSPEQHIRDDSPDDQSRLNKKPLIDACETKAKNLESIFNKVIPGDDASRSERYFRAARTVGKGGRVETLMEGLMKDVLLLASEHGMQTATSRQVGELEKAIKDLSTLEPSIPDAAFEETAFTNNNFGNGPMTNNNVAGDQKSQVNYGLGKQFQAETQTFNMGSAQASQQTYHAQSQHFISMPTVPRAPGISRQICEDGVLDELKFRGMAERYEEIVKVHRNTFQWIFKRPELQFVQWLKSGSGVFWITGKPGSGKSTLMKSIYEDLRTIDNLPKDIENSVISSFFFHEKGTELLLKSQEGLFRAVLHRILSQYRQLIPIAFPERYERLKRKEFSDQNYSRSPEFSIRELRDAFNAIVNQSQIRLHLCLLIDGLDEFSGNYADIIKTLAELTPKTAHTYNRVQLCLSSRPLREFEKAYLPHTHLSVQELTGNDIKLYVTHKFNKDAQLSDLLKDDPTTTNLIIEEILHKSEGVFLWVTLVVRSLIESLDNGDDMKTLQRRLSVLPVGLVPLYKRMVGQIPPFYHEEAGQIFQMVHFATRPLSPLALSFAGYDSQEATTLEHTFSRNEIPKRHSIVAKQLKARTFGLIEMSPPPCQVQYMHLTVKEFLLNEEIPPWLADKISKSGEGDAHSRIATCCLGQLRATGSPELYNYQRRIDHEFVGQHCRMRRFGIVYMIVFHARQAERVTRTSKLSYLRDLDDFLVALPRKCECASRGVHCHWSSHRHEHWSEPEEWLSDFVSYLVALGMTQSVVDVFKNHGYNPATKAGRPLLLYATCNLAPMDAIPSPEEGVVDPAMVKELLKRGCDPNQSFNSPYKSPYQETARDFGNRTVWEAVLLQAERDSRREELRIRWLQVIKLFLTYGAKPTQSIMSRHSALEVFDRAFTNCKEPLVKSVRHFMVSKGAVKIDEPSSEEPLEGPINGEPGSFDNDAPARTSERRREPAAQIGQMRSQSVRKKCDCCAQS